VLSTRSALSGCERSEQPLNQLFVDTSVTLTPILGNLAHKHIIGEFDACSCKEFCPVLSLSDVNGAGSGYMVYSVNLAIILSIKSVGWTIANPEFSSKITLGSPVCWLMATSSYGMYPVTTPTK